MAEYKVRPLLPFFLFLVTIGAAVNSTALFAADIEITVIDGDLDIPLEGARVISWDGTETSCDAQGRVRISVPGDRAVSVRISCPGYTPARLLVQPGILSYRTTLKLGGVLEERELVIEAARPDSGETVSGRSVGISGRELARQSEVGVVEDVMRAVKLLPGIGYAGSYTAMPSVRGGEPADVTAVFDGFYVERPYHWGGAFSIFDPKMVESARLSHGVFSARYGHTVSGLLDIQSKKPSHETTNLDLALSTSAANMNMSFPLGVHNDTAGSALAMMGRVTYWDPFIAAAKLFIKEVRYITRAPYIRSAALSTSHDVSSALSFSLNGFFGGDGVGAHYDQNDSTSSYDARFFWDNKIGFLSPGLAYSPRENILIKARIGAGLLQSDLDGNIYSENSAVQPASTRQTGLFFSDRTVNLQGRFDLDWEPRKNLILSAGYETRYSRWDRTENYSQNNSPAGNNNFIFDMNVLNHGFSNSLYTIFEYKTENRNFGAELGLRADHFLLAGKGFAIAGIPLVNPRLNLDFTPLKNTGPLQTLSLSVGTGLFSAFNTTLQNVEAQSNIGKHETLQNRSWTTVGGIKADFLPGFTVNAEGYFKYVFNRSYTEVTADNSLIPRREFLYCFDGKALIWGFDIMLQKLQARYWDGWIAYSFINAKYRDPASTSSEKNSGNWYYPDFHRFHTLHLIANIRPVPAVQISTRYSLASGIPVLKTTSIRQASTPPGSAPLYIREQAYDEGSRSGWAMPLDIKFSLFSFNKSGKVQKEFYLSLENILSLVYRPEATKDFDSNTGKETQGSSMASYDLPIPLITFGVKWSY